MVRAGQDYDLVLVGYVSRFARDLRTAVNARHSVHEAGAAILFCDERLLSSDEDGWEQWAREAVEAEAYSRRLGRRIAEGYRAKRRRHADPGGHPPFGFRRHSDTKLVEPDPDKVAIVQRIVELAAAGSADRAVAAETGIGLYTVRGVLTSPLYIGRLRDGSPAAWAPVVDLGAWNRATAVRASRATNSGRPAAPMRPYALSMLRCAACGRRLIGDTKYYRHREACLPFLAAKPPRPPGQRGRIEGKGYRRELYEDAVGRLLEEVALGADTLTRVVASVSAAPSGPDRLALKRIEIERDAALARYRRDRDSGKLDQAMQRLDTEEAEASRHRDADGVPPEVAVRYLRDLAGTWRATDGGLGRKMLAAALFERLDATGFRDLRVRLTDTAIAHGFAAAIPATVELGIVDYGRGERI